MNCFKSSLTFGKARSFLIFGLVLLTLACNQTDSSKGQRLQGDLDVPDSVDINLEEPEVAITPKKKIFITFDDGPNKGTENVLNILKDEDVPATFFLVGQHIKGSHLQAAMWDSLRKGYKNLELANHSYSHGWNNKFAKFYRAPDSVVADFNRAHVTMSLPNYIARTPGRNIWRIDTLVHTDIAQTKPAADLLQKNGYVLMGWDLEWFFDHKTLRAKQTPDQLLSEIDHLFAQRKTRNRDNLVLLAHDQVYKNPLDSLQLRQFIKLVKSRSEYQLALVSEYPGVKDELKRHGKN